MTGFGSVPENFSYFPGAGASLSKHVALQQQLLQHRLQQKRATLQKAGRGLHCSDRSHARSHARPRLPPPDCPAQPAFQPIAEDEPGDGGWGGLPGQLAACRVSDPPRDPPAR